MTARQKLGVAWIAVVANVTLIIVASDHHHSIAGNLIAGVTACVVGWWIL